MNETMAKINILDLEKIDKIKIENNFKNRQETFEFLLKQYEENKNKKEETKPIIIENSKKWNELLEEEDQIKLNNYLKHDNNYIEANKKWEVQDDEYRYHLNIFGKNTINCRKRKKELEDEKQFYIDQYKKYFIRG